MSIKDITLIKNTDIDNNYEDLDIETLFNCNMNEYISIVSKFVHYKKYKCFQNLKIIKLA